MESLVALLVLSLGLLGAALMLTHSLGYQRHAMRQSAATSLVADMVERIRADPAALVDSELSRFAADARAGNHVVHTIERPQERRLPTP